MDGLSSGASVIAVIQIATQLGGALKTYYQGVREAREDINRLFNTLTNLQEFLTEVSSVVQHNNLCSLEDSLKSPTGPLISLHTELRRLGNELKTSKRDGKAEQIYQRLKWPFQKNDVNKIVKDIEIQKSALNLLLGLGSLGLQAKHFDILTTIRQDTQTAQNDLVHSNIVAWLSQWLPDPSVFHNAARDKHKDTTGTWLADGDEMMEWKAKSNSFFWLNGGAGAGKSILCSTAIEHLKDYSRNEEDMISVVTFWYYSFAEEKTQNLSNFLCSIVRDLCSKSLTIPRVVTEAYGDSNNGQQRPTTQSLLKMFEAVSQNFDGVYLVVDALDECPRANRSSLLDTLGAIRDLKLEQLHLFVTSRRENDIEKAFEEENEGSPSQDVRVEGIHLQEDIRKFIDGRFLDNAFKKWNLEERERVKLKLAAQAEGMFRLVALQLDALSTAISPKKRREALEKLPTTLDDFYQRTLTDIPEEYTDMAKKALIWIAHSGTALRLVDVAEAVLIQSTSPFLDPEDRFDDPEDILCFLPAGLVKVAPTALDEVSEEGTAVGTAAERKRPTIQYSHYSVKEYLLSQRAPYPYRTNEDYAHSLIVEDCLSYILFVGNRDASLPLKYSLKKDFPLLDMVCDLWLGQAKQAGEVVNPNMDRLIMELYRAQTDAISVWFYFSRTTELLQRDHYRMLQSHWARSPTKQVNACKASSLLVFVGLDRFLTLLLKENLIPRPETNDKLFCAAVRGDQLQTARLLWKAGFNVHPTSGRTELNPVRLAVLHASPAMVEFLFEIGLDFHEENRREGFDNLLDMSSKSTKISALLLAAGIPLSGGDLRPRTKSRLLYQFFLDHKLS